MKTPQNAPFCITVNKKNSGGGQTPPDPTLPGLVACTAKKASYAPDNVLKPILLHKGGIIMTITFKGQWT